MLTLGADPEVFFASKSGELVSAIGRIGGTKNQPIAELEPGFMSLEDNVAAEFNIPPSKSFTNFNKNIKTGLGFIDNYAKNANLIISNNASGIFTPEQLDNQQAQEFGCEPDFNAWSLDINNKPMAANQNLRSCGGHIHIGGIEDLTAHHVIRAMDLFLGVPSVLLDTDRQRRELYGKAGAYRYKDYGAEYRTLSNFWIFKQSLRKWVWNSTKLAVEFVRRGNIIEATSGVGELIQYTINESDPGGYYALLEEYPLIKVDA